MVQLGKYTTPAEQKTTNVFCCRNKGDIILMQLDYVTL